MIDLHSHTTASDGRLSPEELVVRAKLSGVKLLAVTDHDTVAAVERSIEAARKIGGIEVVPGIEISTSIMGLDIHVLGYFVRTDDPALLAFTKQQENERRARMERMVQKLQELSIDVTMAEVEAIAGSDNLCRPHLARVLVARGVCTDMQDAFSRYIGDHCPAFSAHVHPDAAEAIRIIHGAGGVASLAHPVMDRIERPHVESLRALGLDGLEVFRMDQVAEVRAATMTLALSLDLVPTAGSDFHEEGNALGKVGLASRYFETLGARAPK
ncbi:MAG: PHP domain-containing protein [Polyangiales bacterium]